MVRSKFLCLALILATAGCGKPGAPTAAVGNDTAAANITAPLVPPADAPATPPPPAAFAIDSVPLSNAPLGAFPFFGLPGGYKPQNPAITHDYGRFPFWTGAAFRQVEGKVYMVAIVGEKEARYSAFELKKNMESLFAQAGAVKITEGRIPYATIMTLPAEERQDINSGFGDPYNNPVETWVIHRPDTEIWIHFAQNSSSAGLSLVETKAFVATAALLPPEKLKADLDATGKAVIHVNFATDQATILAESRPQIDAVLALLKQDPKLRLAINGYTDETGTPAHNLALSDARAKAVMAALVAAGTDAGRLQAKGYGTSNPIAANDDEAGKAKNRRMELIKL